MKPISRPCGVLLLALLAGLAPVADAESYREWKAGSTNRLTSRYASVPNMELGVTYENRRGVVEPPEAPPDLLLGTLTLGNLDEVPQPIRVRLAWRPVTPDDLGVYSTRIQDSYSDVKRGILTDFALIRQPVYEDEWVGPASATMTVPVYAPLLKSRVTTCLTLEVLDGTGTLRGRRVLQEAMLPPQSHQLVASVGADKEADRLMRDWMSIPVLYTRADFPTNLPAFNRIGAAWVGPGDVAKGLPPAAFLRRLLLMGVWLVGPDAVSGSLKERVALPPGESSVLMGGIAVAAEANTPPPVAEKRVLSDLRSDWGRFCEPITDLDNLIPLFRSSRVYIGWTAGVLLLFILSATAGLILGFYRFKRERRLALWWAIPAWAAAFGLLGWGLGLVILDRREQTSAVEYRFSYGDWPETYCQAVMAGFRLDEQPQVWRLPADAFPLDNPAGSPLGIRWTKSVAPGQPAFTELALTRVQTGARVEAEAGWFRPSDPPVTWKETAEGVRLEVRRDVRQAHLLNGVKWIRLGSLKAGEELNPLRGTFSTTNAVTGLPQRVAQVVEPLLTDPASRMIRYERGQTRRAEPGDGAAAPRPPGAWILVGVTDERPEVEPADKRAHAEGRVIWVMQWPRLSNPSR